MLFLSYALSLSLLLLTYGELLFSGQLPWTRLYPLPRRSFTRFSHFMVPLLLRPTLVSVLFTGSHSITAFVHLSRVVYYFTLLILNRYLNRRINL